MAGFRPPRAPLPSVILWQPPQPHRKLLDIFIFSKNNVLIVFKKRPKFKNKAKKIFENL